MDRPYDGTLAHVRTCSRPSELKITDIRFAHITAASMHCILVKIYTNQGLVGMGEIRDGSSATYAAMLKSRLLGENPCDVDRLFRKIKQFGGQSRQGGGVSGLEIALWDLAGKAYGIPVYRMLGGKFRDCVRMYCDQGRTPPAMRETGTNQAKAIKERMDRFGFKMCKTVLSVEDVAQRHPDEDILIAPPDFLDSILHKPENAAATDPVTGLAKVLDKPAERKMNDYLYTEHPYTMLRVTDRGLDRYEEHIAQMREVLGWRTPLAIDHVGHMGLDDAKRLMKRLEKYNLLWCEDVLPWYMVDEYVELRQYATTPLATGEDAYLTESFEPLCKRRAVAVIHPDICSNGGILETKKMGDMAQKYNTALAMHMCETPVAALATTHAGVATENFFAMEFNAPDDDYWQDIVTGLDEPLIQNGTMRPNDKPGLGMEDFNDEVLREHQWKGSPEIWQSTEEWDKEYSYDRLWS